MRFVWEYDNSRKLVPVIYYGSTNHGKRPIAFRVEVPTNLRGLSLDDLAREYPCGTNQSNGLSEAKE